VLGAKREKPDLGQWNLNKKKNKRSWEGGRAGQRVEKKGGGCAATTQLGGLKKSQGTVGNDERNLSKKMVQKRGE